MYKYKIGEEMAKLTLAQYKYAGKEIPRMLDIAYNTFNNYRRILIDDHRDVPYQHIIKLEHFFGLPLGSLTNVKCDVKTIHESMRKGEQNS